VAHDPIAAQRRTAVRNKTMDELVAPEEFKSSPIEWLME
jgi:hypothetical protein